MIETAAQQPYLHDLLVAVRAPAMALVGPAGQIGDPPAGATGIYLADRRVIRTGLVSVEGAQLRGYCRAGQRQRRGVTWCWPAWRCQRRSDRVAQPAAAAGRSASGRVDRDQFGGSGTGRDPAAARTGQRPGRTGSGQGRRSDRSVAGQRHRRRAELDRSGRQPGAGTGQPRTADRGRRGCRADLEPAIERAESVAVEISYALRDDPTPPVVGPPDECQLDSIEVPAGDPRLPALVAGRRRPGRARGRPERQPTTSSPPARLVPHPVRPGLLIGRPDAAAAGHRAGGRHAAHAGPPAGHRQRLDRPRSPARSCTRCAGRDRHGRASRPTGHCGCRRSTTARWTRPRSGSAAARRLALGPGPAPRSRRCCPSWSARWPGCATTAMRRQRLPPSTPTGPGTAWPTRAGRTPATRCSSPTAGWPRRRSRCARCRRYAYEAAQAGATLLDAFGRPGGRALAGLGRRAGRAVPGAGSGSGPGRRLPGDGAGRAGKRPVDALASNIGHLLGTGLLDRAGDRAGRRPARLAGAGPRLRTADDGQLGGRLQPAQLPRRVGLDRTTPRSRSPGWPPRQRWGGRRRGAAASLIGGLLAAAAAFDYRMPELYGGASRGRRPAGPCPTRPSCRPQAWSAATAMAILAAVLGPRRTRRPAG